MAEDTIEKPVIGFRPLEIPRGEVIETPQGSNLELLFQDTPVSKDAQDIDHLKSQARVFLGEGYDYFRNMAGPDFNDLSDKYVIEFVQGRFRHGGILMHMDVGLLRELAKNPSDQYTKDLVQSVVVHEIGHNITVQEDIPMFAEMIYMIEKGHVSRIAQIKKFFEEGNLGPAHIKGLAKISEWLGYSSSSEMLSALPERDPEELKNIFRQKLEGHTD